jgi:hypothetical protein
MITNRREFIVGAGATVAALRRCGDAEFELVVAKRTVRGRTEHRRVPRDTELAG